MKLALVVMLWLMIISVGCTHGAPITTPPSQNTTPPDYSVPTANNTASQNVVEVIKIFFGERIPTTTPTYPSTAIRVTPPPGWSSGLPINPRSDDRQGVYLPSDKIYFGLRVVPKTTVTFSKYTLLNKETGEEVVIPSNDLGPFNGEMFLFFNNQLSVPNETGNYEFRIYLDKTVVASAVFEVVSLPK